MIDSILNLLKDNPAVETLISGSTFTSSTLIQEALLVSLAFQRENRPVVVVKNSLYGAQRFYDRIKPLLDEDVFLFSTEESLRVDSIASSPESMAARIEILNKLLDNKPRVLVTHLGGLIRHLPKKSLFKDLTRILRVNDEISMDDLCKILLEGGYSRVSHVDQPLCFASRGGIVDFYSMNYEHPIRVEFFDTVIESIRFFDINSQKTIETIDTIKCIPASDILFSNEDVMLIKEKTEKILDEQNDDTLRSNIEIDLNYIESHVRENKLYAYYPFVDETASILDYINNPLIILENQASISDYLHKLLEENTIFIQEMVLEKKLLPKFALMHDFHRLIDRPVVYTDDFSDNISGIEKLDLPKKPLLDLLRTISNFRGITILVLKENEMKMVIDECVKNQISYNLVLDDNFLEGLNIGLGTIYEGFRYKNINVIGHNDLFDVNTRVYKYENKFKNAEVISDYKQLNIKDYVVHNIHGIGQYVGLETRNVQGINRDFLKILYRGNAELLVPLEQFSLVRKFVSKEGIVPKLNKLGSSEWSNTKSRIKENIQDLAKRLVSLYASRDKEIGFKFSKDTDYQKEFESKFEYPLTKDQAKAIEEVKKDMESSKPMDRLICGDVGFGKTEVAIRAAFKAVQDNKQVAFLCPTTILASQHFKTFSKRFKEYPINVRVLNRFSTPNEIKDTLERLMDGRVDILIGTHRILSKDVIFKDLGLLIIDEEQRFGVEHKEKIKELKTSVDVLSLSATPIPRTLQMSLIGIRQLSQLETPPDNRYPVQTYVVNKNDRLIKSVIEKELSRDGQVFYLYNNVDQIYGVARKIQNLVPEAKISVVHGKMHKDDIENTMIDFTQNKSNVLVCTTIIETGIDISNANTIIIQNADLFGLSQLYQIKGRVGRSNRISYAYLMVEENKQLSEIASKRLKAIKEFATLGSGYKIAMRDLTIRGAGDMLGPDQSGFIDTVGIDMYIEMLEEAIKESKNEVVEEVKGKSYVNVGIDGYIPESFTNSDIDKISMYQDIEKIATLKELTQYKNKIIDEYGRLPKVVNSLFEKKRLDLLLNDEDIERYKEINNFHELVFSRDFSSRVDGVKLFEIFTNISKDISIKYTDGKIIARLVKSNDSLNRIFEIIERSKEAIR